MNEPLYTSAAYDDLKIMKAIGYGDGTIEYEAIGHGDGTIEYGKEFLYYHDGPVNGLSFGIHSYVPLLASAGEDHLAIVWKIKEGRNSYDKDDRKWSIANKFKFDEPVSSISLSSDGQNLLAIALRSGKIHILSILSYEEIHSFNISGKNPKVCYIPDLTSLAIGNDEGHVFIYQESHVISDIFIIPSPIISIAANSSGIIAVVFENSLVKIIDHNEITDIEINSPDKITLCAWDPTCGALELTNSDGQLSRYHLLPNHKWKTLSVLKQK